MFVTSSVAANSVAGGTFNRIRTRLQPHFFRDSTSRGPALRLTHPLHASLVEFVRGNPCKDSQGRAATVSGDENLKAKSRAAAGESKEERYPKVGVIRSSPLSEARRRVQSWRESPCRFYGSAASVKVVRTADGRYAPGFCLGGSTLTVLAEPRPWRLGFCAGSSGQKDCNRRTLT
jgi:hypothetical protein